MVSFQEPFPSFLQSEFNNNNKDEFIINKGGE